MRNSRRFPLGCAAAAALAFTVGSAVNGSEPQSSCVVGLTSPEANAAMPQVTLPSGEFETLWRFSWSACPGASRYHLFVIGPNAQNPIVNLDTITGTSHTDRKIHRGITQTQGWTWKVRAFVNGTWTAWSETRTFNVGLPKPSAPTTCSIRGRVDGRLQFTLKDDRGQPVSFEVREMVLVAVSGGERTRARLLDRSYNFNGVRPGTYSLFPVGFRGVPKHERRVSCVAGDTLRENFTITAVPRVD